MADEQGSEEAIFLQAKLGDLDIETLQKLLQTAIAKKTKEPEQHGVVTPAPPISTSTDEKEDEKNRMAEMNDEIEVNKPTNGGAGGSELPVNSDDGNNEQAQIMADKDFSLDKDFSQNIPPDDQEKESNFVPTQVTNTGQQSNEAIALPESPNTTTVNLEALKINEDNDSEEFTGHVSEKKPALTSMPVQNFTPVDKNQFTAGFIGQSGQGNYLNKMFPDDQQNPPLNQASMDQNPTTFPGQIYTQPKETLSNTQWNTPSNTKSGICKLDQKAVVIPADQQNFQPSTNKFNSPSNQPPASYDQEYQTEPSLMSTPSNNSSEDFPSKDLASVVPPLYIPISKVSQYLPKGTAIFNKESWIPLALRPVIVLKNEVAVMVFEQDDGLCRECEKDFQQQNLQEQNEKKSIELRESCETHSKQQPPQLMQEEPVEPFHQQASPYVSETTPQIHQQNSWQASQALPQQQTNHSPNLQGQQLHDQQASQQWLLTDETLHYQEQQPEVTVQGQQQQYLQQQQQQQQQQRHQSPNFNPSMDPNQYQSIPSFPQPTDQSPSQPQHIHRTSSLPHLPTQIQAHQANTNQQSHTQSNFVPGLKAPIWMSDEICENCHNCGKLFTVTRRKHHCRGCGKIFCSDCCDQLAQLPYLGRKVARICVSCTKAIRKAYSDREKLKQQKRSQRPSRSSSVSQASTQNQSLLFIPEDNVLPDTAPPISRPENNFNVPQRTTEAYPTTPTGNFNPVDYVSQSMPDASMQPPSSQFGNTSYDRQSSLGAKWETASVSGFRQDSGKVGNSWKIPPRPAGRTIAWTDVSGVTFEEQKKRFKNLNKVLKTEEGAVIQAATRLSISVKKIQVMLKQALHEVWSLTSIGFENCGLCEVSFLLEKRIAEDVFPYEMLKVYRTLYSLILNQGEKFDHCNYLAFNNPLLGSEENAGFLFIRADKAPTLVQRFTNGKPLLFGILLKQPELLWAKYVPTRLLNALGVQQQTFPSPAISSRDRPSVCTVDPNELYYSTFYALNKFLNYKIPQALIPGVNILKSGSKVVLELPFAHQTEIIKVLDNLLIDESKPVTLPIAGDLVPGASGHFVYSPSNATSTLKGFVVLQNNNERLETGNQYLSFSAILLVLTFGDACNAQTRFGLSVIEDGISVHLSDNQAREIRKAIYQGTNCAMSLGHSADSSEQFSLRWTGDTCPSILDLPTPIRVVQNPKKPSKGYYPATAVPRQPVVRTEVGQTNVMIDRVKTRDVEAAIQTKITSDKPQQTVEKLENDVRQACAGCLLTFANRLKPNTDKRLNLTLELGCGNYKKWTLGPNNQPINLARALQLALNEIVVPDVNDEIVFVFNVILQKRN